ncbi:hypothetical protein bas46_0096 [Escherichia phage ChristianSchoenbein]|nr:hypothetical protein bas46_0096 [Escherichia phage ChristianSchoenbein]WEW54149.1 putative transmembrane protein [Escherichia phage 55]
MSSKMWIGIWLLSIPMICIIFSIVLRYL